MPSRLLRITAAGLLLLLPLFAACGDDDGGESATQTATPDAAPSVAGPQQQPPSAQPLKAQPIEPQDGVIEITAAGLAFQENYLRIPEGQAVVIRVTNGDTAAHNLRIAGLDGVFGTEDDALTSPDTIGPGQLGELTFAPPVPGAYTFRCDFHPGQMGGQVVAGDATPGPAAAASPTPGESATPIEGESGAPAESTP